jgi:type IV secretion system protein VirB1
MDPVLSVVAALALAHQCAPGVAPDTIVSIADAKSGLYALAVHDNASGTRHAPDTPGAAIALATDPIVAQHHSVDLGLMQVNGANLPAVDLSVADAFDACQSMRTGSEILSQAYHHALRAVLSIYNTGHPVRGIINGYVAGVEAATAVPSIVTFAPAGPARAAPTHYVTASAGAWNTFIEGSVIPSAVRWHAEAPQ